MSDPDRYPLGARLTHYAVFLVLAGIAAYLPYMIFGVTPFTIAADVAQVPPGPAPEVDPYAAVQGAPELSEQSKQDFMWCRFCHSFEQGGPHAVGPNLYRVFGRRAGSAPGFYYSEGFVEAGKGGLIWDDASVDALIADPEKFLDGRHRMRYKPITDPAARAQIVAALKAATK